MKCPKCSKKVNKADLKGVPWNDWPLSKPKIKWLCPSCYQKEKSDINQMERASLEAKWEILNQIIDQKLEENDIDIDLWKRNKLEYAKFIEDHARFSVYALRTLQYKIRKKIPKGTTVFEQTRIVKPGDPFS